MDMDMDDGPREAGNPGIRSDFGISWRLFLFFFTPDGFSPCYPGSWSDESGYGTTTTLHYSLDLEGDWSQDAKLPHMIGTHLDETPS